MNERPALPLLGSLIIGVGILAEGDVHPVDDNAEDMGAHGLQEGAGALSAGPALLGHLQDQENPVDLASDQAGIGDAEHGRRIDEHAIIFLP